MNGFYFIDHPADIEVKSTSKTFEEALKFSIYGMVEIIADRKKIKKKIKKSISVGVIDYKEDVYKILTEILYIFETEYFLPKDVNVKRNKKYIIELEGQQITGKEEFLRTEIKAVTYHNLKAEKINNGWEIRVMFDV